MKPTIGRIVHFFTHDPSKQFNGNGPGPYPALITQTFGSDTMANLKVFPGFGPIRDESSVPLKNEHVLASGQDYWDWPLREGE